MISVWLHLALSHFVVFGYFVFGVLGCYALWKKNHDILKLSLGMVVVSALIGYLVYNTGEKAEHVLENWQPDIHELIEVHEELAEKAIWLIGITGLGAALLLFLPLEPSLKSKQLLLVLVFTLTLFTSFIMMYVAHLGGNIRHPEKLKESPEQSQLIHLNDVKTI